jgi:hypothetical protein
VLRKEQKNKKMMIAAVMKDMEMKMIMLRLNKLKKLKKKLLLKRRNLRNN